MSCDDIKPDLEKLRIIRNYLRLTNTTELKSFNSLTSYCYKFIRNSAQKAPLLKRLLEKEIIWNQFRLRKMLFHYLNALLQKLSCSHFRFLSEKSKKH